MSQEQVRPQNKDYKVDWLIVTGRLQDYEKIVKLVKIVIRRESIKSYHGLDNSSILRILLLE